MLRKCPIRPFIHQRAASKCNFLKWLLNEGKCFIHKVFFDTVIIVISLIVYKPSVCFWLCKESFYSFRNLLKSDKRKCISLSHESPNRWYRLNLLCCTTICFVVLLCSKSQWDLFSWSLFVWLCLHKQHLDYSLFFRSKMHLPFIYGCPNPFSNIVRVLCFPQRPALIRRAVR